MNTVQSRFPFQKQTQYTGNAQHVYLYSLVIALEGICMVGSAIGESEDKPRTAAATRRDNIDLRSDGRLE